MKGFRNWWGPLAERANSAPDAYNASRTIGHALESLTVRRRGEYLPSLVEELADGRNFGVALCLMETLDDENYLKCLAEQLRVLPPKMDPDRESHLADVVRVLAVSSQANAMEVAREYLLEREITAAWETVPWALWPDNRFMFLEAWTRFFLEIAPRRWKDSDVVRSFLAEAEAVEALRARMHPAHHRRWHVLRRSMLRQLNRVRWLSAREIKQLSELLR